MLYHLACGSQVDHRSLSFEVSHASPSFTLRILCSRLANIAKVFVPCIAGERACTGVLRAQRGHSMAKITIPAARVRQGALMLFTTSMKVGDLVADNFYSVETLDPANSEDKGYQRLLNTARAKKLADYILNGQDSQDAFLPTSVFLATSKPIPFDEGTNTIQIDTSNVGAFSVV